MNPYRTTPTISWLPNFVYVEHLLGSFALCIFFFNLGYATLLFGDTLRKNIDKITKKPISILLFKSYILDISKIIGFICGLGIPIYYELNFQSGRTIKQLPFDILGFIAYLIYIRWAYRTHSVKSPNITQGETLNE